jgi:hypothetical protein
MALTIALFRLGQHRRRSNLPHPQASVTGRLPEKVIGSRSRRGSYRTFSCQITALVKPRRWVHSKA